MSFKGQSSGAAAAPQTKFKRGDLFDLVQEVAAEGGPRWSELLADNHLVEATRDIDGISRHGLYLAAPHKEDSGLRRAEYSALYRHYVLTPSGKPWTTCPLPLLEFPFTAAEFMRFNSLLVDDLRALLTTIRTVEGEDGNRFLDEQINHELVADLPDGAGELARILLSGDTAPSVSAPAASLAEPVRFADLPRVMAEAMHTDPMARAGARINLEAELVEMVASGRLKVRDSLTHGPHTHPVGDALKNAVLLPDDVRQLLAERGVNLPAMAHPMTTERQAVSSSPPVPPYSHALRDLGQALEQAIAALAAPSFEAIPEPVAAPAEAVAVTPNGVQKREMVKRHAARWPTIETDMKDAGKNGLAAAAKAGERGWREAAALDWARERSRLLSAPEPGTLDAVMGGGFPSRRHTLAR